MGYVGCWPVIRVRACDTCASVGCCMADPCCVLQHYLRWRQLLIGVFSLEQHLTAEHMWPHFRLLNTAPAVRATCSRAFSCTQDVRQQVPGPACRSQPGHFGVLCCLWAACKSPTRWNTEQCLLGTCLWVHAEHSQLRASCLRPWRVCIVIAYTTTHWSGRVSKAQPSCLGHTHCHTHCHCHTHWSLRSCCFNGCLCGAPALLASFLWGVQALALTCVWGWGVFRWGGSHRIDVDMVAVCLSESYE